MSNKLRETGKTSPEQLRNLIIRKLHYQWREYEKLWASQRRTAYSKLSEKVLANLQDRRLGRIFNSVPLELYGEIVDSTIAATKEWPGIVWETIEPLLKKGKVALKDGQELNRIIDDFAWATGQDPFMLRYIDPEPIRESVYREASRYGIAPDDRETTAFNQALDLKRAAAQSEIMNSARQAREGIRIAIDEYLISLEPSANVVSNQSSQDLVRPASVPSSKEMARSAPDCLPNPPKKKDEWFEAIGEMTSDFYNENGHCPTETEAWARLYDNPPSTYGIKPGKDRGEYAVFMHDKPLGRSAFGKRWRRYTNPKSQKESQ